jgi:hypothetical protein
VEIFCRAWNAAPTPEKISLTHYLQEHYGGQTIPVISAAERKRRRRHDAIRHADSIARARGHTATDAEIASWLGVSRATVVRVANSPGPKERAEAMQKLAATWLRAVCPHANLTMEQIDQRIDAFLASYPFDLKEEGLTRAEIEQAADAFGASFLRELKRLTTKASP